MTGCTRNNNCSNHGTASGYVETGCSCSCDAGYSGADCGTTTACTPTQVAASDKAAAGSITGNAGDTVTVTCNDGYGGGGTWTCGDDGNFSGTICSASACTPTQVANSDKAGAGHGGISGNTGDTVEVQCDDGYTGGGTWTCLANGDFSGNTCTAGSCTATQVANSDKSSAGSITGNTGDTVTVTCDGGYTGGGTWTCGGDGNFSGSQCTAGSCTPTQVANSNKARNGDITGNTGATVVVTCNAGYTGGGNWVCGNDGNFTGTGCSQMTSCTSADDCNDHASAVTGYREDNTCSCTCATGYTGDTCGTATSCTIADNCSGQASAVSGDVATGCSCTCNAGRGGNDCSTTLTACTVADDCGGPTKATAATGYRETGCTCQCNALWTGANCSTPSDPDADPCIQAGFACVNGGSLVPDGAPGAGGALPGSCGCAQCDTGYTDGEGTCDDATKLTRATCEADGSTWTPTAGYTCGTPNENCTLSTDAATRDNSANGESGVYFCANGGSINTIRPYSDASGRLCGCVCGQGDQTNFLCKNSVLDTANLQTSCENNAACSYSGSRLTCQPNGQAFQACADHTDAADCGTHSECAWDGVYNKCIPSQTAKDTCSALTDNQCLSQGSGCTLRGDCQAKVTSTRTGFGGAHCDIPQDAILASAAEQENLAKGIIWCNNQGYASGKTGNASCVCFPGFTGNNCENKAGADIVGCPVQDGSCPAGQACCDRPNVDYCTGQAAGDGSFPEVDACTRAKQARLGVGQSRQQRCEQQSYVTAGGAQQFCKYHDRDPTDSAWNYFDQGLNSDGANRLHPKCQCDCERKKSGSDVAGPLINADQRYQASEDGLSCIANCSQISPGDTICDGLEGEALQQCKEGNSPCFGRGVCNPTTNKCLCNTGYAGDYCEYETSGFQGKDCGRFGEGAAPPAGSTDAYQCVCKGDWSSSGLDLNADGIAKCDLDPCHQGVTRRTSDQSFPSQNSGAIPLDPSWTNNVLAVPTITVGMGVRWNFAESGKDLPDLQGNSLTDVQSSLKVTAYAPAGSTPVYDDFEQGTNANALAGNYPYEDATGNPAPIDAETQKMLFKMQGEHSGNTSGGNDKVYLNYGTFLDAGTVLDFFYRQKGTVSCRVFDTSPGGAKENCTQSSDGLSRACDCKRGWYTSPSTETCTNRCKFGTWGPGCIFKMDGTTTPDPTSGMVPDLCDQETLNDDIIDSLMEYSTADGLPSRCAGKTTRAAFRAALNPTKGSNATCRVVDTGSGALDIQYDCLGTGTMDGPTEDAAQVAAVWMKGTNQNGGETDAGGWVVHDDEGQCVMDVGGDKVLCQLMGTGATIRENNGHSASDCTMENTGNMGTCDGAMASTADQCATEGGTWTDGNPNMCKWERISLRRQCPSDNAGLDGLYPEMEDRAKCRTMQCNITPCGPTDTTPDSWHATQYSTTQNGLTYNQLQSCVKNAHGGASGSGYACSVPDVGGNYQAFTVTDMTKSVPSQFADGSCYGSTAQCDNCGFLWAGDECSGSPVVKHYRKDTCGGANSGGYQSCVYDAASAPACD
ncbi:hypothetical protein [uncultured Mediterranean phage]|nr:hypothetical protein [uncultured Mediterranean phage]